MWLKIKQLALPVSVKLTALYAIILSCILLSTSLITVAGLHYMLYIQTDDALARCAYTVSHYLRAGNPLNQSSLKKNLFPDGITLQIMDQQNSLLFDNTFLSAEPINLSKQQLNAPADFLLAPLNRQTQIIGADGHFFYFLHQTISIDNYTYQLYFFKPMTEQSYFLTILMRILLITNALGLLFAVISGIFISHRILKPLRSITATAKMIEINDLGRRIPVTDYNDELQELAKTFNHMLNRIQAGFEQQRRLIAAASHELRTPITVISGYANMLDRWGKKDPDALEEGIGAIKSEAANMYSLIEKLLFLARADHGKQIITKMPLVMRSLLDEVAQETRLIAPNHQIYLSQDDEAIIYADAAAIKQMLRIFIENSIKYTPQGKEIRIDAQKKGNYLEVSVQDNGIGIPEEDQPNIFDRFYRVDKSRTKSAGGGTGLGLSIARWIAEQHSSSIHLTSKLGEGTRVAVMFPLYEPAPAVAAQQAYPLSPAE